MEELRALAVHASTILGRDFMPYVATLDSEAAFFREIPLGVQESMGTSRDTPLQGPLTAVGYILESLAGHSGVLSKEQIVSFVRAGENPNMIVSVRYRACRLTLLGSVIVNSTRNDYRAVLELLVLGADPNYVGKLRLKPYPGSIMDEMVIDGQSVDSSIAPPNIFLLGGSFHGKSPFIGELGEPPLFTAIYEDNLEVITALVKRGARITTRYSGLTALQFAAHYRAKIETMAILVFFGSRLSEFSESRSAQDLLQSFKKSRAEDFRCLVSYEETLA